MVSFKKIKTKFVLFLFESSFYNNFVQFVLPRIFIKKKLNLNIAKVRQEIECSLLAYLNTSIATTRGVVIGSRDPSKLAGKVIPGDIDHVGILDCGYVIEAKANGVIKTPLDEFILEAEGIVLCYGIKWNKEYRNDIANKANTFIGRPYDRKLSFGSSALYCSEVCFESDFNKICKYDTTDLAGIGRDYISPVGVLEAVGMTRIYDSRCFEGND